MHFHITQKDRGFVMKAIILVMVLALGIGAQSAEESTSTASRRVLIAYEETRFKTELVEAMTGMLEGRDGVTVETVNHAKGGLDSLKTEDYDAVFITVSGVKSTVRPWVAAWLEDHTDSKDKILLHVTQTRKWTPKAPVDAITSASAVKKADTLAKEYVDRLLKITAESEKTDEQE